LKTVQQSRQQMLRAYCPNIYTVPKCLLWCSFNLVLVMNFFGQRSHKKGRIPVWIDK
jgi:hypothetical protein